ncbi:MAG: cell division protein SepF [Clostridiales bacterium]|nr:cell division protein SepF [Clostridiales bacterium]MDD7386721.1 cell division protein SepF [Bacillota bacterium]MDY6040451.1 cell division protein SepF [Candidatus Faecousia sp.]
MSFWDNVKKFAQPYADDDYDDYNEDDEYLDDYDEPAEPARRAPARRSSAASAPVQDEDDEEDYSLGVSTGAQSAAPAGTSSGFNGRILNTGSNAGPKQEVVLFRPASFNDTSKAADHLRNRKAVVLNLENVDKAMSRRVVDFLSGCVYAVDGSVKKIAQSAYLFCPANMDVVGDLESLQAEVESYI